MSKLFPERFKLKALSVLFLVLTIPAWAGPIKGLMETFKAIKPPKVPVEAQTELVFASQAEELLFRRATGLVLHNGLHVLPKHVKVLERLEVRAKELRAVVSAQPDGARLSGGIDELFARVKRGGNRQLESDVEGLHNIAANGGGESAQGGFMTYTDQDLKFVLDLKIRKFSEYQKRLLTQVEEGLDNIARRADETRVQSLRSALSTLNQSELVQAEEMIRSMRLTNGNGGILRDPMVQSSGRRTPKPLTVLQPPEGTPIRESASNCAFAQICPAAGRRPGQ